jgi:hypothetical protein
MKQFKQLFMAALVTITFVANAQENNSLDAKNSILDKLKGDKAEIDKKIAATEAEITAMKPVKKFSPSTLITTLFPVFITLLSSGMFRVKEKGFNKPSISLENS